MAKFICNFISYTLKRTVDITVIIPSPTIPESLGLSEELGKKPSHLKPAKYPVVYLLHGYGNNHAQWTGYTNVELFAEEQQIAIVNLSAENKCYVKVGMDDFFTFVSEELPEFVTNNFPVSDKPEDNYIAGLSMGGYGTLVHAFRHPERFHALGAFSAAISINPETIGQSLPETASEEKKEIAPEFDPSALVERAVAEGKKLPKIYMACGNDDHLLKKQNDAFHQHLLERDIPHEYQTGPGGHDWVFWDTFIHKALDWLPLDDASAGVSSGHVQ